MIPLSVIIKRTAPAVISRWSSGQNCLPFAAVRPHGRCGRAGLAIRQWDSADNGDANLRYPIVGSAELVRGAAARAATGHGDGMPLQRAQRRYLGYVIATALALGGSASPALAKPEDKNAKAAKPADTKPAAAKPAAKPAAAKPAPQSRRRNRNRRSPPPKPRRSRRKCRCHAPARSSWWPRPCRWCPPERRCRRPRSCPTDRLLAGDAGGRRHIESGRHRRTGLCSAGTPRFASGRAASRPRTAAQRPPPMSRSQSRRSIWFAAARPPRPARFSRRFPIRSRASSSNGRSCAARKTTQASTASPLSSPITRAGRTPRCCAGAPRARCGTRSAPPTPCAVSSPHRSR